MTKDNAQREELIEKARRFAIECHGEPTTESHTQQLEGTVDLMADFALEIANSQWVTIRGEADLPKERGEYLVRETFGVDIWWRLPDDSSIAHDQHWLTAKAWMPIPPYK